MVWPITARLPCLLGADVSRQPRASQSVARALALPWCPFAPPSTSLKLRVLRLGFLQDRDVGVGVFPEGEKVLVGHFRFGGIARKRICSSQLKVCQRPN